MDAVGMVDVVGVGLNATDTVFNVEKFPAKGSKVEFKTSRVFPGGQTASAMVACQRWGMKTRYVGKLGDDIAAELHREAFAKEGVETQLMTVASCASQQSVILVDGEGERTVLHKRDQRLALSKDDLQREWIVNAHALHVDGYDTEAATQAAVWAREAGIPVLGDLDDTYEGIEALLPKIDYLIVNNDFSCRLMNETDVEVALKRMYTEFGSKLTGATLGHDGVLIWDGRAMLHVPAFRVKVADTTGAGDLFRAGFLYGLKQGWDLKRQLDFASGAAALNCMSVGARGGIKSVAEIEALVAEGQRY